MSEPISLINLVYQIKGADFVFCFFFRNRNSGFAVLIFQSLSLRCQRRRSIKHQSNGLLDRSRLSQHRTQICLRICTPAFGEALKQTLLSRAQEGKKRRSNIVGIHCVWTMNIVHHFSAIQWLCGRQANSKLFFGPASWIIRGVLILPTDPKHMLWMPSHRLACGQFGCFWTKLKKNRTG